VFTARYGLNIPYIIEVVLNLSAESRLRSQSVHWRFVMVRFLSLRGLLFCLVSIVSPVLHTDLHLCVAFTRRRKRTKARNFSEIREEWIAL
jgi:hypothetical protein